MVDRYKGTQWKNFKLALKRGFTYGLALELMFIGSGYMLYREYTTNREFRERVEDEFPQLTEYYNVVSGMYLKVMPKRLRDQILETQSDDSPTTSAAQTTVENASNATNPTHPVTGPTAIASAAAAMATTITQKQPDSTPNK